MTSTTAHKAAAIVAATAAAIKAYNESREWSAEESKTDSQGEWSEDDHHRAAETIAYEEAYETATNAGQDEDIADEIANDATEHAETEWHKTHSAQPNSHTHRSQGREARAEKPGQRSQGTEARAEKPGQRSQGTEARAQKPGHRSQGREAPA
jgi:hypothetical protein